VATGKLVPRRKLRCTAPRYDAGGGGVNVSRVIKELGGESLAFVAVGGGTGSRYLDLLGAEGIETIKHACEGDTRFSLTVMESATGEHFRFVLPGPEQSGAQDSAMLSAIGEAAGRVRYVVASGSLPPGLPADFYMRVAEASRDAGARLILDTSGPALKASLPGRPYCIRINHYEAGELLDLDGPADIAAARRLTSELVAGGATEVAIVTVGEAGAVVASAQTAFEIHPPEVAVVSAVGAGDSFVGALALGLSRDWPLPRAVRFGVAAAAAAVTTEATELCHRADAERYFSSLEALAIREAG
jgi:6-phosphofructokinase 2